MTDFITASEVQIAFPFHIDGRGRVAGADEAAHVRQMIEQVLFTVPGERINRPEFGCGLQQLVFDPNSDELAATTEFLIQGGFAAVAGAIASKLRSCKSAMTVPMRACSKSLIRYVVLRTQTVEVESFVRPLL